MVEGTRESGGDVHVDAEGGADQLVWVGALEDKHKDCFNKNDKWDVVGVGIRGMLSG